MSNWRPKCFAVDIRVDQLYALAGQLSLKEVAEQSTGLDVVGQVSVFGLFESALSDVRALTPGSNNDSVDDVAS